MRGLVNQGGGSVLTGNMIAADLLLGKTGYSNDPKTKLTGTMVAGKKFASGTAPDGSAVTVAGLTFTASTIVVRSIRYGTILYQQIYCALLPNNSLFSPIVLEKNTPAAASGNSFTVTSTGFGLTLSGASTSISWVAYE